MIAHTVTLKATDQFVVINLDRVTSIAPINSQGGGSIITFDAENTLWVKESVQDLALELAKAR